MQGGNVTCPTGAPCHCTDPIDTCDTCGVSTVHKHSPTTIDLWHRCLTVCVCRQCCRAAVAGEFYRSLGADVAFKLVPHAHHGFVTDRVPAELAGCDKSVCVPCGDKNRTADGLVQECGYDMAGALLGQLLGLLKPRTKASGQLVRFNQSKFWPAGSKACNLTCSAEGDCPCTGMFHDGLVYIPTNCGVADIPAPNWCGGGCDPHNHTVNPPPIANGTVSDCRIHVVYPGCSCCINEGPSGYGIPRYAGFNEYAESNDIIVLYPQQDGGGLPSPCWDAIKDPNQSNRKGLQMNVVNRIVDWLGGAVAHKPQVHLPLKSDDSTGYVHPAGWHTAADITRIRAQVRSEWQRAMEGGDRHLHGRHKLGRELHAASSVHRSPRH